LVTLYNKVSLVKIGMNNTSIAFINLNVNFTNALLKSKVVFVNMS